MLRETWGEGVPVALALDPTGAELYMATTLRLQRRDARDLKAQSWEQPLARPPAAIALAPDGATLALAVGDQIELRTTEDGRTLASLSHSSTVQALAFAPDGALLAAALGSEAVIIWDLAAGVPLRELRLHDSRDPLALPGPLTSLSFAPDGARLATSDQNGNVVIWRLSDGTVELSLSIGLRTVSDVAFSPDGTIIAAASGGWRSEAGAIWLWDAYGGEQLARLTIDDAERMLEPVLHLAFAHDGGAVIAGTARGNLLRWAWPSGELERETLGHHAAVSDLVLTPGGGMISAGRDGDVRRWSGDGFVIDEVVGLPAISAVAAGGGRLAMGGEDGSIALWQPGGRPEGAFAAHQGQVNALAISPDGALLASGGEDGIVRLWALPDGAPHGEIAAHQGPVLAVTFSPTGAILASSGWDGTLQLWDVPEGGMLRTIMVIKQDGLSGTAVLSVDFSEQGTAITGTAYDGEARRFAVADGALLRTLRTESGGWLIALAYRPDGIMAALDDAGLLWAWAPDGGMIGRSALADATALTALADGRLLTVGPAGGLRLWSLDDEGPLELGAGACVGDSIAASPDGRIALVGSRRGFVELWALP
jgi:WD40 repeat protein